jgi:hypothetical protein
LLDRRFSKQWPMLKPVFSHLPTTTRVQPEKVQEFLGDLRDLRNAIAHHDPIIDWPFAESMRKMDLLAGPISPVILKWMKDRSRVTCVLLEDPRR